MDAPGTLIAGRYELREQIGAGGAGTVYRARDRVLGRDVAVKRLRAGADEDVRARLGVEARLSGSLAHPGIARVHDFGEEGGGTPSPYLVMEYVDGPSLREHLRDHGPLPVDRVMSIVAQVADALAVAHAAGVVHRDVKPGNILVRPDGTVVLVDFGIARALDHEPLTLTGTIVGTVDYISPEQAAGQGATRLSDLYSLGMVAYECLTGIRPLRRDAQVATLLAHVQEDVPPLPGTLPPAVREVVRRLTARDPRRRPADAAAAAGLARAALGAAAASAETSATTTVPSVVPSGAASVRRRRRLLVLAPVAAAAACLAYLVGSGDEAAPPASARAAVAEAAPASHGASPAAAEGASARPTPAPASTDAVSTSVRRPAAAPRQRQHAPRVSSPGKAAHHPKAKKPGHGKARKHGHAKAPKKAGHGHGKARGRGHGR